MKAIRAITICQPHAWAVVFGDKPFENRSWPSSHRGPLMIHAGMSRKWLRSLPQYEGEPSPEDLVFGAFIGVVDMVGSPHIDSILRDWPKPHQTATGPWCHHYRNPRPLDVPVSCPGRQNLWIPPVAAQLAAMRLLGEIAR